MMPSPQNPFFYFLWKPPRLTIQGEQALAKTIRGRGFLRMSLLFVALTVKNGKFDRDCLKLFLCQNYILISSLSIFIFACFIDMPPIASAFSFVIFLFWGILTIHGVARHTIWMIALLFRNPPLSNA